MTTHSIIMKFVMINSNGEFVERTYIQIGTVMTRPEYRRRGLAGKLVKEIVKDYRDRCDGIYLFGNLSALDFYSELGFRKVFIALRLMSVRKKNCISTA